MTIKPSWRTLIDAKIIKRTDTGMCVRPDAIRIVPGFNLRDITTAKYKEGLVALKAHISRGGHVPPLEVALSPDGKGVDVVEGHRRTTVYWELIADGQPIEWVRIEPFNGNEVERKTRVLTSQDNEKLLPLEIAEGYRQLQAFGLSPDDIARRVCKTRQHVDQMLILATAPHAVQTMVADGTVKATTAIEQVRKHGDKSSEVLAHAKAKAGGGKVTAGAVKPWAPPAKYAAPLVKHTRAMLDHIPADILARAGSVATFGEVDEVVQIGISMKSLFNLVQNIEVIEEARQAKEEKQREKAAKASQLVMSETDGA